MERLQSQEFQLTRFFKGGDANTYPPLCACQRKREITMKKEQSKKEPEVYYYYNAKGVKLWGYRHRYYDALDKRREKSAQGLVSETVAIRALLEIKTDLINGNIKRVDNTNLTVSEWLDIWFETHENEWKVTS